MDYSHWCAMQDHDLLCHVHVYIDRDKPTRLRLPQYWELCATAQGMMKKGLVSTTQRLELSQQYDDLKGPFSYFCLFFYCDDKINVVRLVVLLIVRLNSYIL